MISTRTGILLECLYQKRVSVTALDLIYSYRLVAATGDERGVVDAGDPRFYRTLRAVRFIKSYQTFGQIGLPKNSIPNCHSHDDHRGHCYRHSDRYRQ